MITAQVKQAEKYNPRTLCVSFFFIICSVGLYFSWFKAKPYQYQEDFIIIGLLWQIIGTILLAGDALNVRWLQEKTDTHMFFFHDGWICEYIDLKKHLKYIFTLDRKIITPFKMLICASLAALIVIFPYTLISGEPLALNINAIIFSIKCAWLVFGSLFLIFSDNGMNVLILIIKIIFIPLVLFLLLILSGPFAIGEVAQIKFQIKKKYIATGLVLVIYGAILQGISAINWSDIQGSNYLHSDGIGLSAMAGDLLFKQSMSVMRNDELMYYDFWSNSIKKVSANFSHLVGFRYSGNYDNKFMAQSLKNCELTLRNAVIQFNKNNQPTVFAALGAVTLSEISNLQMNTIKWQIDLDKMNADECQALTDEIWESLQKSSKLIEEEVKLSFLIINDRKNHSL